MLVLTKSSLSKVTLFLVLITPAFITAEVMSIFELALCIILLCAQSWRINKRFAMLLLPLLFLLMVGLHGIFYNTAYDIFKDAWYFWKPIPQLIIGFILMKYIDDLRSLLLIIILAALFVSLMHISGFIFRPELFNLNFKQIREEYSRGFLLTVIGLFVILVSKYHSYNLIRQPLITPICAVIFTASLYLSFSRTLWSVIIIFIISTLNISKKSLWKIIIASLTMILIITISFKILSIYQNNVIDVKLIEIIKNSALEIIPSNYLTESNINQHWRGYESYIALKKFKNEGNVFNYLFGFGFGALVDLEIYIKLGKNYLQEIPVFHNGYIHILLKTGILGFFLYIYFLFKLIKIQHKVTVKEDKSCYISKILLKGLIFTLAFTTIIIGGLLNKSALAPDIILIGSLTSFLLTKQRKHILEVDNAIR